MTLNTYSKNPKIREIARKNMTEQVDNLIAQVKELREKLIEESKAPKEEGQLDELMALTTRRAESMMKMEEDRYRKASKRQKKDVEQFLMNILIAQEMAEEARIREMKEMEKLRQREEQAKLKAEANKTFFNMLTRTP